MNRLSELNKFRLDLLKSVAKINGIEIEYTNIHKKDPLCNGYALTHKGLIYIDQSIKGTVGEVCALSEEMGHCLYPPRVSHADYHCLAKFKKLSIQQQDDIEVIVEENERLAHSWGTSFIIPDKDFWDFVKDGPKEMARMIEYFDVTDWFMRRKIGLMCRKYKVNRREMIKKPLLSSDFSVL